MPLTVGGELLLTRFDNSGDFFVLRLPENHVERKRTYWKDPGLGSSGFAQNRKLGLWNRRSTLIALFVYNEGVWFFADGQCYPVTAGQSQAMLVSVAPFVWRFRLVRDQDVVFEVDYWWFSTQIPADNEDLFGFIAQTISGSANGLRRFEYGWRANLAGRSTTTKEFLAELEEHAGKP